MSTPQFPDNTPNVVIHDPKVRRAFRITLDTIGAILFIAMAVDASSEAVNWLAVTTPVMAGWVAARTIFGFGVDDTNTPK